MRPDKLSIFDLFQMRNQYLIPLFQRGYVWTLQDQVLPLWEDIMDRANALEEYRDLAEKVGGKGKLRDLRKHFLGTVVVGAPSGGSSTNVPMSEVIDGQQRITTLYILLLAFRDVCSSIDDEALHDDIKLLTRNRGNYPESRNHLKVWPTNVGRDIICSLFEAGSFSEVCKRYPATGARKSDRYDRPLLVKAYLFFYVMIESYLHGIQHDDQVPLSGDLSVSATVIKSIEKDNRVWSPSYSGKEASVKHAHHFLETCRDCFQIMSLLLEEEDDPQIIFETLNARGAPLQPSDLVRNFIFLEASRRSEDVDYLYNQFWRYFDELPDDVSSGKGAKFWRLEQKQGRLKTVRLDLLLYYYVGMRKRQDIKVSHVFDEFKTWWGDENREIPVELDRLLKIANHFKVFLQPRQESRFDWFCRRMKLMDTSTATPLLFYFLEFHNPDSPEFTSLLDVVESYFVRRFICGLTAKGYNQVFLRVLTECSSTGTANTSTVKSYLSGLQGESIKCPTDEEFSRAWRTRSLYQGTNTSKVRAILEALELSFRGSRHEYQHLPEGLTVEHVMPQKWEEQKWPLMQNGSEEGRNQLLHSIGNLTLVTGSFNSSLSNESYDVKKKEIVETSLLSLNAYFQKAESWNEEKIIERAEILLPSALKLWPRPE